MLGNEEKGPAGKSSLNRPLSGRPVSVALLHLKPNGVLGFAPFSRPPPPPNPLLDLAVLQVFCNMTAGGWTLVYAYTFTKPGEYMCTCCILRVKYTQPDACFGVGSLPVPEKQRINYVAQQKLVHPKGKCFESSPTIP